MAVDLGLILQPWRLFKINNATERVKQILQQFFAFELQGELGPPTLSGPAFEDPYVFGYLGTVAMSVADSVTTGLTTEDKSRVARGAVIALSGMGARRYTNVVSETMARRKADFIDGMRDAEKMVAVMYGRIGAADDPEVADAFKTAAKLLPSNETDTAGAAAAVLRNAYLGQRLKALGKGGDA